ncbi:MAG: B12-binding domain-containing radical SAM protein [Planctomycetota bacterium]|jgi:radical SAM superfamily enzyme YgiQ (UPF0313 family)
MRLLLINPTNPLIALSNVEESRWNRYRIWKPLSLLTLAGLTPRDWEVSIRDENLGPVNYPAEQRPDLVGITAFSSQANRAYEIASDFKKMGVPVVMGGIHASMRPEEAMAHVDSVVTGEAESVWRHVLEDVRNGGMERRYNGEYAKMVEVPTARHDLLPKGYAYGAIQTTRGCPLNCSFCSVTAFNGRRYRHRPIENVIQEFKTIREKNILIVDDNLIGTRTDHMERAKDLFRAMIKAKLRKGWFGQVTINMADDDELLYLARKSGCKGIFIGFESPTEEGLAEIGKKFNARNGRNFRASVRRIHRYNILVVGSFIIGLDTDTRGIGRRIAEAATQYGVDILNAMFLTPLPGTRLWNNLESEGRIAADDFPEDWQYYTLNLPVARYRNLSTTEILAEMEACNRMFYSLPRMTRRLGGNFLLMRRPFVAALSNLSYKFNLRLDHTIYRNFMHSRQNVRCFAARQAEPLLNEIVAKAASPEEGVLARV